MQRLSELRSQIHVLRAMKLIVDIQKQLANYTLNVAFTLEALDCNCSLQTIELVSDRTAYVGIRAHQITFLDSSEPQITPSLLNTFPCWLAQTSETPHRMTVYLKLNHPPTHVEDYDLQAEVFREKWDNLKDRPLPWQVQLDPLRVFVTES